MIEGIKIRTTEYLSGLAPDIDEDLYMIADYLCGLTTSDPESLAAVISAIRKLNLEYEQDLIDQLELKRETRTIVGRLRGVEISSKYQINIIKEGIKGQISGFVEAIAEMVESDEFGSDAFKQAFDEFFDGFELDAESLLRDLKISDIELKEALSDFEQFIQEQEDRLEKAKTI